MTYGEVLPIWWSMIWRGVLGAAVAGFIAGFIVGFIGAMLGQADAVAFWAGIAGLVVAMPVSLWSMRAAINKHHLRPAQSST